MRRFGIEVEFLSPLSAKDLSKKLDIDYMSHRLNGVDKVYQEIPTDNNCEITTMKDRLEDKSVSDRIDPNLLNPFRQNPYSQPLDSFAY